MIPTNQPVNRADQPDLIYKTEDAKFDAVVDDVASRHEAGQPVLLGTVSIEKSERLARLFTKRGIRHEVLNAKLHAREAEIIAQAGRPGAVTVATNMAGRGVDIMLGGNPEGMAKVELKRQGLAPDSPDYDVEAGRPHPQVCGADRPGQGEGQGGRWALRGRYRETRVAPDRQSAPWAFRPARRRRGVEVLPIAGRRSHEAILRRPGLRVDGPDANTR